MITVSFRILTATDKLFTRKTREFTDGDKAQRGAYAEKAFWEKRGFVCYFDIQEDPSGIKSACEPSPQGENMFHVYDSIGRYLGTFTEEEAKSLCEDSEDTMVAVK